MNLDDLTCAELVELVSDYVEGELDDAARTAFEEHLVWCPACTTYLDQIRATIAAAGRLTEDSLPPAVREELLHAFRDWARP